MRIRRFLLCGTMLVCLMVAPQAQASFSAGLPFTTARTEHSATLLQSGKVLIAGGRNTGGVLSTSETYDVHSGSSSGAVMAVARSSHTATLLDDGRVLIVGGVSIASGAPLSSAEIYDPATNSFSATDSMAAGRSFHTATLLQNGKVLVAGGVVANGPATPTSSFEVYDPDTEAFSAPGVMGAARYAHSATLLPNGKVLIAGGLTTVSLAGAELYTPSLNSFSSTDDMVVARAGHSATLLTTGNVLITGGVFNSTVQSTAELYDVAAGTFAATGSTPGPQYAHSATLLVTGMVLITGGFDGAVVTRAHLYNPSSGAFTPTSSLSAGRHSHTATLLADGRVLVAGGSVTGGGATATVERFDGSIGAFTLTGEMATVRYQFSSTLLPSGQVLVAGGRVGATSSSPPQASCEIYDPASNTFVSTGSLLTARYGHTATLLANGKVLIAGGVTTSGAVLASAELYDVAAGTFSAAGSLIASRALHSATLLRDGRVLFTGGATGTAPASVSVIDAAEVYDPLTGTFSAVDDMISPRASHTATLLPNGHVLVVSGINSSFAPTPTAERFVPADGSFEATTGPPVQRQGHTATLLTTSEVLIVGGRMSGSGIDGTPTAELYDPVTDSFTATGSLTSGRSAHTATLLPSGKVLVTGGSTSIVLEEGGTSSSGNAWLYDRAAGTFTTTDSMNLSRQGHKALLLLDGQVLVAGGLGGFDDPVDAELYDDGAGVVSSRRPVVSAPAFVTRPASLQLTGSGFRSDSEGGSGNFNSSPANYPLVQIRNLANEEVEYLLPLQFSDSSFLSVPLSSQADGHYAVTLISNGSPSIARIVMLTDTPAPSISSISPDQGSADGGQTVTITGANLGGAGVVIGGNIATVTGPGTASVVFLTPPHFPGGVDVIVSTIGGVATTTYTYTIGTPVNVIAEATSATAVLVSWTAVVGATDYEVVRSSNGTAYMTVAGTNGTAATDFFAAANTAYLYKVRAFDGPDASPYSAADLATTVIFTDDPIMPGSTAVRAVHLLQLRTGVNAVRVLAGIGSTTFAGTVAAGAAIQGSHVTELRSALDPARSALGLAAMMYGGAIGPGTVIHSSHVSSLRDGVR